MMQELEDAVTYLRVSLKSQVDGTSLDTQRDYIQKCAESRGYRIVKTFSDPGVSAKRYTAANRPAMRELLSYISNNPNIKALMFFNESRLSREFDDFVLDVYNLLKNMAPHCKLYKAESNTEFDPYDIVSVMEFASAKADNMARSDRAISTADSILDDGVIPGGRPPYGYRANPDVPKGFHGLDLIVYRPEALIVRFVFHLASLGHSVEHIAIILDEAKIPPPSSEKWNPSTLSKWLRKRVYVGQVDWNFGQDTRPQQTRLTQEGNVLSVEPIIAWDTWYRVQSLLDYKAQHTKFDSPFLLRELLFCCGQPVSTKDRTPKGATRRYLVYTCPKCRGTRDLEWVHTRVMPEIMSQWSGKLLSMAREGKQLLHQFSGDLKGMLDDLSLKLERTEEYLRGAKVSGDSVLEDIHFRALTEYQGQKAQVTEALGKTQYLLSGQNIYDHFEKVSDANLMKFERTELRALLLHFVEYIVVSLKDDKKPSINFTRNPYWRFNRMK